jgi:hypothetical protein
LNQFVLNCVFASSKLGASARPFPLWRLHSGQQSSSVDQYSETPPEHLASSIADAMLRSVVTRNCLSK